MEAMPAGFCLPLVPCQPYNFAFAQTYFTRRAGELVDRVGDGAYRRLFATRDGLLLAEVRSDPAGGLQLFVRSAEPNNPRVSEADLAEVALTLTRTLGLEDDARALRAAVASDRAAASLIDRYSGLRLISTPSPFEAFVWAVIGQQISLQVAFRLKAALVQRFGASAEIGGVRYWAFPTPSSLADAYADEVAALGLGRRKARTITYVAGIVARGDLCLEALARLPLDEAEADLTALPGVGPWTAHYTLLRGLRVADACPASDMGLRQACGTLFELGRKASVAEVTAYAERWRPFRGHMAFYLWFMLSGMGRSDG